MRLGIDYRRKTVEKEKKRKEKHKQTNFLTSDNTINLQSSRQDNMVLQESMVLAQKQKYRIM